MELLDILGRGICHMDPARSLEGGWLCSRCIGLYAGGLIGVVHATTFSRRMALHWQLAVVAVLFAPMAVDTLILGRGSPVDVNLVRAITGSLAGFASGLLYGSRGLPRVRLDPQGKGLRAAPVVAWIALLVGAGLWTVGGVIFVLDMVVLAGLALLCATATAWGVDVALWVWARWRPRPFERSWRIPWMVLGGVVLVEFLFVALLPNAYKPNLHWISWIWERT